MPRAICRETCGTDRAGQADNEGLSAIGQGSKSASELALQVTQQAGLILGVCFFVCMLAPDPNTQDFYCFHSTACFLSHALRSYSLLSLGCLSSLQGFVCGIAIAIPYLT